MRINKYLARQNYSTRKGGDELVKNKKVTINGKIAVLGDKVMANDVVEVLKNKKAKAYFYFAYNKPKGIVTQQKEKKGVWPIGRLDKDSQGLMILTDDGRITDRLLNPDYTHDKEYVVTTTQKLRPNFKQKMESGVNIEGYLTRKCVVQIINDFTFKITITEGKKHQIRRMLSALFNEVKDLKRTRIMNIHLGNLAPGASRVIEGEELSIFLAGLQLQ